ncbi:MAG: sedoheptulokinase [Suipraeoptans sp.]
MKSLGIDIGTTSISFVILETTTNKVTFTKSVQNDSFIQTEYSYERAQDVKKIIEIVLSELKDIFKAENEIDYIGLTGQMHGVLYIDAKGEVISPLYTWQDGSGDEIYRDDKSYAKVLTEITGYTMASGFGATTYYVHSIQKRVPIGASKICTIMDYLGMVLSDTDTPVIDSTNAASLGLYDVENRTFDKEAIKKAGLDYNMFPDEENECHILGCLDKKIPVGIAIGDNQASFIGSVKDTKNSISVNVGTGSQISFVIPRYISGEGYEVRPFIDEQYLLVKSGLCGGRSYALLETLFQGIIEGYNNFVGVDLKVERNNVYAWMDYVLSNYKMPSNHPITMPLFNGTRENPTLRASISNISTNTFTHGDLIYSLLEGMVEELCTVYDLAITKVDFRPKELVGSGNGIRFNSHLKDLFENRIGMEMKLSANEEEAACGAALNGLNYL